MRQKTKQQVEILLYNYKSMKTFIENAQNEIEEIKDGIILSCQGTYERLDQLNLVGISSGNLYVGDTTGETVIKFENNKAIKALEKEIAITRNQLERIDKALENLSELEYSIISKRYFDKKEWKQVEEEVSLSRNRCDVWRKRGLRTIAISLFGVNSVRNRGVTNPIQKRDTKTGNVC
jgi:DNA-directed RNA polymerase sigma subunit (sigma70/sigma32)